MLKSIVSEIKKIRNFNTPKKIIISSSNFKKLKDEIGVDYGLDVSNLMVYGVEIQANALVSDNEMIKIMHNPPQIPGIPVFNFSKEHIATIAQSLANAANSTAKSFRELGATLRQAQEMLKKTFPQIKKKRKRRAHFKPHLRRRLKRIHR